jgi:hypothetical protein
MTSAAKVLGQLAATDPGKLPRYKSERSQEVFARLVATGPNLAISRDKATALKTRVANTVEYGRSFNEIAKLYLALMVRGRPLGSETIEMMASELRLEVVMADLSAELIPTFDKKAADYQFRLQGVEKTRQGIAISVAGAFQSLTEKQYYDTPQRLRMLAHLLESVPQLFQWLSPQARQESLARLRELLNNPELTELHAGLKDLQGKLEAGK